MLAATVFLIPLAICLVVTISLVGLFRTELKAGARATFYSFVMHSCVIWEIIKDIANRKKNILESAAPSGEVVVVTGARGIGFEVIKKLMEKNAHVIIGCRGVSTGERAVTLIREAGVTSGTAHIYKLDLSSPSSVRDFAENVLQNHPEIHILVNNAGVTLKDCTLTKERHEMTFATNYLGHCLLTHLLLARLAETATARGIPGRIVNVASVAHRFPFIGAIHFEDLTLGDNYNEYLAYGQSKLAQVMFTLTLDTKLRASGVPVRVFALHPGIVYTSIVSNSPVHRLVGCVYPIVMRNTEQGARCVYYACASPDLESKGGAYLYSCMETPPGKSARSEKNQAKLWAKMLEILDLKSFGNI